MVELVFELWVRRMGIDYRLAIDPGDIHVGWAEIRCLDGDVAVGEWTPNETTDSLRRRFDWAREHGYGFELIIEEFVLYPNQAKSQAGSSFQTSQLIGALKLIAHDYDVPVIMQGAHIKKPTRRQLKARGIKRKAVGAGIHASDAEEHLYHRHLREKKREEEKA